MIKSLRRLDRGLARGEAALAAVLLLIMITMAAVQAVLRNLTNLEVGAANVALEHLSWADSFLQKGTLALAFLGASLATFDEKHIAIDVLHRISKPRMQQVLRAIVSVFAGLTSCYLARVFWLAILNNAQEIPLDYSLLGPGDQMIHLCEASAQTLADAGLSRPQIFCVIRSALEVFGATMPTPEVALQLFVPAMLLFMAVRFWLRAGAAVHVVVTNTPPPAPEPVEEA